jgi:uncharacterized protein (DUF2252 family)
MLKNFGTYLDNNGILNFDEGYLGPFTWDIKRLIASLNFICYTKGFSDRDIAQILSICIEEYLKSIADNKKYFDRYFNREGEITYKIKDIVQRSSPEIGSAEKISYQFLIEGQTETLENDIILYMKPAQKSAVSYVVKNENLEQYFQHDGLRIVLCSYAMQASTPRWLRYTTLNSIPLYG